MAFIIVMYFLTNTFVSVARVVSTFWNGAMAKQTQDNIIALVIVFVLFTVLCIMMIYRTQKEMKPFCRREEDEETEAD